MLSLRSLAFGAFGKTGISRRDEAEEWVETPPESVAIPTRLPCGGGRELVLRIGKDVVRVCMCGG